MSVSSDGGVKALKVVRADARPIQESQSPHQKDGPQGALLLPATERSCDRLMKCSYLSGTLQPPAEFDIFHQRDIRESAELFKDMTVNEQGVIARGNTAQSGTPVHECADHGSPDRRRGEGDIEAAPPPPPGW